MKVIIMRRVSVIGIVAVCFAMCVMASTEVRGLEIVRDGQPAATIVVPKFQNDPRTEKWIVKPARWLRKYIKQSTGAELKIVEEGQPVDGNIISVGRTKLSQSAGISLKGLKWDGGRMVVKGNTLYLIGRDEIGPVERDYVGAKGTCRMATTFLEDYLGIRWYIPSPMGEMVPKKTDIVVPDDLDRTVQPKTAFLHGPYLYGIGTPGSIANNARSAVRIYTCGGHTWQPFLAAEEYFDDHPEYFALIGGERSAGFAYNIKLYARSIFGKLILPQAFDPGAHRNHLCTTHPDVKRILLREVRKRFDMGYDWVQLGQSDGYKRCQCPKCEALDSYRGWAPPPGKGRDEYLRENVCERIHLLHKAIIDECRKSHPDKTLQVMVYGPTKYPSKKFDRYGDNVVAEICGSFAPYTEWRNKVRAASTYAYWFGLSHKAGLGLKPSAKVVAGNIRQLHDKGCVGIYLCGGGDSWGLDGPAYYVACRAMDNPELDWMDCLKEYCGFVYGKAGPTMVTFFVTQYKREGKRNLKKLYAEAGIADRAPKRLGKASTHYLTCYSPEVINQLEGLLSKAEAEAESERAKGWLRLTRDYFDLTKGYAEAYECYRLYEVRQDPANLQRLKQAVDRWKAVRARLLAYGQDKQYIATWFPSWVHVQKFFEGGGCKHSGIDKLFTEDIDKLTTQLPRIDKLWTGLNHAHYKGLFHKKVN